MRIKISVIGSIEFCHRTEQLTKNRNDIEIISYSYDDPKEASTLIHSLKPCDVIFFSGSLPYTYAKKALETISLPSLYLKQDETAIVTSLLYLSSQFQIELNKVSIDVREKTHINHIVKDLNGKIELPFVHLLKDEEMIQDIISFHEDLSLQKKTQMAITSVHAVYEKLLQKNIPAIKMIDPESSLLHSIEIAKQQAILSRSVSSQIAVGTVKGIGEKKELEVIVKKIASIMQALWSEQDGDYTLFTTMGNLEYLLQSDEFHTLFQGLSSDIKIAFGCGETIVDATVNAQLALGFAYKNPSNSLYILDANKKLHGPYPQYNVAIKMKIDEPSLVEMATKTKLGPANISKLVSFSKSRQSKHFTANDLALYFNVSRRTAERTLKKLVEFNYVKVVGEEMAYSQGRPRALYEFNFATYH